MQRRDLTDERPEFLLSSVVVRLERAHAGAASEEVKRAGERQWQAHAHGRGRAASGGRDAGVPALNKPPVRLLADFPLTALLSLARG